MSAPRPSVLDQVQGARAAGALLVGDLDGAVDALILTSNRYLVGFCFRFAVVSPSVSLRIAWGVVRRRLARPGPFDRT